MDFLARSWMHHAAQAAHGAPLDLHVTADGELISEEEWNRRRDEWLPSSGDRDFVESLMPPEWRPGH